jgi:hypothetical protein
MIVAMAERPPMYGRQYTDDTLLASLYLLANASNGWVGFGQNRLIVV